MSDQYAPKLCIQKLCRDWLLLPTADMIFVPGSTFLMGSDNHCPEEAPVHGVTVDGFWIGKYAVTNEQFERFVKKTDHVTWAERPPGAED